MKKTIALITSVALLMGLFIMPVSATSVNPVVYLNFDGNLKDTSGNGYDGSAPDANIEYVTGVVGKAAKIDSAMITLQNSKAINWTNAFSLSTWIRLDPDVTSGTIMKIDGKDEDGSATEFFYASSSYSDTYISSGFDLQNKEDPTWGRMFQTFSSENLPVEINKEKFMHLAIVYNGTTIKYYIDGKLDSTHTYNVEENNGTFFSTPGDINIGGTEAYDFFHGWMDELKVYNTAINFADITELYTAGKKTGNNSIILTVNDPYMMVNGTKMEIDPGRGTTPVINAQNRTIRPIRAIIGAMGGTIGWDGSTSKVTITKGENTILLWINKDKAEVNGDLKEIDPGKSVTPEIINERTMLPIRFILEELGLPELGWNGALSQITIKY